MPAEAGLLVLDRRLIGWAFVVSSTRLPSAAQQVEKFRRAVQVADLVRAARA